MREITDFAQVAAYYIYAPNLRIVTTFHGDGYNDADYKRFDMEVLELLLNGEDLTVKPFLKRVETITDKEMQELSIAASNISAPSVIKATEIVTHLTTKGYDVFGLIDKGLAYDEDDIPPILEVGEELLNNEADFKKIKESGFNWNRVQNIPEKYPCIAKWGYEDDTPFCNFQYNFNNK